MGCWFSYLRSRSKQKTSPISSAETTPSKTDDRLFLRSHILTLSGNEALSSPENVRKEMQNERHRFSIPRLVLQWIKAKFLKACGALLKTPSEFTSPSKNPRIQSHPQDRILPVSVSHHDPSIKELQWDEQCVQSPDLHESDHFHGSTPPQNLSDDIPVSKTKSVRFEAVEEDENKLASGRFSISIDAPQKSSQLHLSSPNYSPGSTPLKLNEEMDTPGTVYPSKSKSTEIRCQFVHPLSKATVSQMVLSPELTVDGNSTTSYRGPKPDGEIEVQSDDMSPEMEKLWDGKGIPNSTKKYNEDQMIKWHSTPFVERIEKALTGDLVHPKRLVCQKLVDE